MKYSRTSKCLILEWSSLPQKIKDLISKKYDYRFHNDCFLPLYSEFEPNEYTKGISAVEEYWKDQKDTNGYKGTFDEFVKSYGLELDVWIIKQNFDLSGINEILIEISW